MGCPDIHVKLKLDDTQRTKLYSKGRFNEIVSRWSSNYLSLRVDCEVLKQLDPARVVVDSDNELRILDSVNVIDNEVYLGTFGTSTNIMTRLVDYIVDNDKRVFDVETLQYLYKLQDEVLENKRKEIEENKRKEEEERRAREILKDEIERYRKEINDLNKEVGYLEEQLDKKNRELEELKETIEELKEIIEAYAEFIESKDLTNEFIEYVKEKEDEEYTEKLKQKYYL